MTTVHGEDRSVSTGLTVDDTTFAARLALVRHRMGWNLKEAARECGQPAASWRMWEEGSSPRRKEDIARAIVERTGCDFYWLLLGEHRGGKLTHRYAPRRPADRRPGTRPDRGGPIIPPAVRRPTRIPRPEGVSHSTMDGLIKGSIPGADQRRVA